MLTKCQAWLVAVRHFELLYYDVLNAQNINAYLLTGTTSMDAPFFTAIV
jgi:hypothetical protein